MATIFTHAALPWLASRGASAPVPRKVLGWSIVLACVADLDLLLVAFDVRPDELLGHRGLTHSLLFAGLFGALGMLVTRADAAGRRWLLLSALSHPLVDLFTQFEAGVALFGPWNLRLLSPLRPVPSLPLGLDELLSRWGALVLLNEALFVVAPFAIALALVRRRRLARAAAVGWAMVALSAWLLAPEVIAPQRVRVITAAADLPATPGPGIPGDAWLVRFEELRAAGLIGQRLMPERVPWSSGFFPAWYGREAGRWQEGRLTLISRTLFGARPPTRDEVAAMTEAELWRLSPIEKYDLLTDELTFKATRESLSTSHNARPRPRFWNGLCNGISAAAMERPEPTLEVDAVSPSGRHVRFHPLDVKALLGLGYYFPAVDVELGGSCEEVRFDAPRVCAMSPVLLTLATANALGRAKQSFQLDVHATLQAQYYAVASAEIVVLREPYEPPAPVLEGRAKQLVDVELRFELSNTTLPDRVGDVRVPGESGRYEPVGLRAVPFAWKATLALGEQGALIGGKWWGDGPDSLVFPSGGPELLEGRVLTVNPGVEWKVIDSLARRSAGLPE